MPTVVRDWCPLTCLKVNLKRKVNKISYLNKKVTSKSQILFLLVTTRHRHHTIDLIFKSRTRRVLFMAMTPLPSSLLDRMRFKPTIYRVCYRLDQCSSTFWTPSPGRRQIFKFLSRSSKMLCFCTRILWFSPQNTKNM